MTHVTCDSCGKPIRPGEDHHYSLKVEVLTVHEPAPLTEDDLEDDHLDAMSEMLDRMDDDGEIAVLPPVTQQRRFDLCSSCRERFLRDPLGKDLSQKFDFSEN
jgi:hypothetical protein